MLLPTYTDYPKRNGDTVRAISVRKTIGLHCRRSNRKKLFFEVAALLCCCLFLQDIALNTYKTHELKKIREEAPRFSLLSGVFLRFCFFVLNGRPSQWKVPCEECFASGLSSLTRVEAAAPRSLLGTTRSPQACGLRFRRVGVLGCSISASLKLCTTNRFTTQVQSDVCLFFS